MKSMEKKIADNKELIRQASVYQTLSLRIEDEELKDAEHFLTMHKEGEDGSLYEGGKFAIDQKQVWPSEISGLRKAEDGVYVGLCRIESIKQEDQTPSNMHVTCYVPAELTEKIRRLFCRMEAEIVYKWK